MTSLEQTLLKIACFLKANKIPYMVIGGVANLFWGVSRTTLDVDITIQIGDGQIPSLVRAVGKRFRIRVKDPQVFISKTHVLPLEDRNGIRIDLIIARLSYQRAAIRRAKAIKVGRVAIKVCSPEDLILHKVISDRAKDREDVRGVIQNLSKSLDRKYLDPLVKELAEALAKPGIWKFYRGCFS